MWTFAAPLFLLVGESSSHAAHIAQSLVVSLSIPQQHNTTCLSQANANKFQNIQCQSALVCCAGPASEKFPVVVTSYEIVIADSKLLQRYKWKYIVVDEGHRLKNFNCKLLRELRQIPTDNKLLLTGNSEKCISLYLRLVMVTIHLEGNAPLYLWTASAFCCGWLECCAVSNTISKSCLMVLCLT